MSPDPSLLAMEILPFTEDAWSLSPIVAEQVPWFKGKDVAKQKRCGITLTKRLIQGENETFTPSNQQPHEMYINESGFSKQPAAKSFKRWVTQKFCFRSGGMGVTAHPCQGQW